MSQSYCENEREGEEMTISEKKKLVYDRLEKILQERINPMKCHFFSESVVTELKYIMSEIEFCLQLFESGEDKETWEPITASPDYKNFNDEANRTKSLEVAIMSFGEQMKYTHHSCFIERAQHFYTYITKGE